MSTTGSVVLGYNAADITVSSQTLGSAAAFAIAFSASQAGIIEACLFVSLPANHGGFALNWLLPTTTWPFARIRDDWSVTEVGTDAPPYFYQTPGINDPQHADTVIVARPDSRARIIKVRGTAMFKAPAGGGAINLQGCLAGSGASVVIQAGSAVEGRLY